jgi:protoporphyrinogen oxidase
MVNADSVAVDVLVLGGGPCGLGAARQLGRCGVQSWLLLESATGPGGLASSFVDEQGFTWDVGGHAQFSHYDYFDAAMDEFLGVDGWNHLQRESWVWFHDRFVPYPFQNNLHRLTPADRDRCVAGLVEAASTTVDTRNASNFLDWIRNGFGPGIAELFMEPYNAKVWAHPLDMMGTSWMGERVAAPDLARVLATIESGVDDVSWGPNSTFRYPKRGGTGAIWSACAAALPSERVLYGERVVRIDLGAHRCFTSAGREIRYGNLVSTMPLDEMLRLCGQAQFDALVRLGLLYSASNIIGLGLRGQPPESLRTKCWLYFPGDNCPFYRATVLSNYANDNVPEPGTTWSLMLEVAESAHRPVDQGALLQDTIDGALRTSLIADPGSIVSTWQYRARHGYPTPGARRDEVLAEVVPFLEQHDVLSRGRFGMWRYEVSNQDHSFMQGVEAVERIVNGRVEFTAFDPDYVNSRKHPWPFDRWSS